MFKLILYLSCLSLLHPSKALNDLEVKALADLYRVAIIDGELLEDHPNVWNLCSELYFIVCDYRGSVVKVAIRGNLAETTIPSSIGHLTQLQYLYLSFNKLIGTIPESIGNLTQLHYLNLSYNNLIGTIPESIGQLTQLHNLYILFNKLSGPIPNSIGKLESLHNLDLSFNELSGQIPDSIGNIPLNNLYLISNKLNGTIPESIGKLSQLYSLYLSFNDLTGTIPESFGHLSHLYFLDLSYNQLRGFPNTGYLSHLFPRYYLLKALSHQNESLLTHPTLNHLKFH